MGDSGKVLGGGRYAGSTLPMATWLLSVPDLRRCTIVADGEAWEPVELSNTSVFAAGAAVVTSLADAGDVAGLKGLGVLAAKAVTRLEDERAELPAAVPLLRVHRDEDEDGEYGDPIA